jgi:hypothetical protein
MKFFSIIGSFTIVLASSGLTFGDEEKPFAPSIAFRTIHFVEYGGGPVREYVASKFETSEVLYEDADQKLIVTTATPPSTATRTWVAGLFLLKKTGGKWVLADARRFEAIGKEAGARAEATQSERAEPHISVTLFQGGRGASYSQCVSYVVKDGSLVIDPPQEKPIGEHVEGSDGDKPSK